MAAAAASEGVRHRKPSLSSDEDYGTDDSADEREMQNIVKDIENDKMKPENQVPDSRWTKMKATMKQWGETSSCHGIPHMAQAHTLTALIIWAIIMFFCACGFVYLFSDTLLTYLAFGKLVQLNLAVESSKFPSITFCNINPYKLSMIEDGSEVTKELSALLNIYKLSASGTLTS